MGPRTLLVAVALGAALAAQSKVIPAGLDSVEGQFAFYYPFNRVDGDMFLLYDAEQVTGGLATLTGIDFRIRQPGFGTAGFTKPYRVTAYVVPITALGMVQLGANVNAPALVSGVNGTVLFQGPVAFPANDTLPAAPAPFGINMPFTLPYVFDPTQGNLMLRIQATDTTPAPFAYPIDAVSFPYGSTGGIASMIAAACGSGGGNVRSSTAGTSLTIGGSIDTTLTVSGTTFAAAFAVLGLDRADVDLTPYGMPGCTGRFGSANFAVQALLAAPTFPHVRWQVPNSPAYVGRVLVTQTFGLVVPQTTFAVSNAEALWIGSMTPRPVRIAAAVWTGAAWFQMTTGEVAPVVRFDGLIP
jgi:hypothetical protein